MGRGRARRISAGPSPVPCPLLTAGARPAAAAVIALCIVDVAVLGIRYAGHTHAGPLDMSVDSWVQARLGGPSPVLTVLTWLGDPLPVTLIVLLVALGCTLARWWRGVALAVLTVPAASGLTEGVLKPAIDRTIDGSLSLPSGHTTAVVSLATVGAVLLSRIRAGRLLTVAAYVLAAAVAASMVAQGYHYFTDTIAGAGVGIGIVLIGALFIDAAADRLRARRVTAPRPVTGARSPGAGADRR